MVEFALVIGLFVLVLYGLIAYGLALDLKQNMTHAATEGARAAIGAVPTGVETQDDAAKRVALDTVDHAMASFSQWEKTTAYRDASIDQCGQSPPTTAKCITAKISCRFNAGCVTNRCHSTAWNASACGVTCAGFTVGTTTHASADCAV